MNSRFPTFVVANDLQRSIKLAILLGLDALISSIASGCALYVASQLSHVDGASQATIVLLAVPMGLFSFWLSGLYRVVVSHMTIRDVRILGRAALLASVLFFFVSLMMLKPGQAALGTFAFTTFLFLGSAFFRLLGGAYARWSALPRIRRTRVLIYGAGQAGLQLAAALYNSLEYEPIGFVDDDGRLQGRMARSLPIYSPEELKSLVERLGIERILLAIPSASKLRRQKIIARLESLRVQVSSVPRLEDVASGRTRVSELRPIEIEDLLDRNVVPPDANLLRACIDGKVVMVTGAGGSIGSELCRQAAANRARQIVLYEISEPALYNINEELIALHAEVNVVPILGTTMDRSHLETVCRKFGVETIYHAAAYKHVPLVEHNIIEGSRNNIVSTMNVVESAKSCGVELMVLISSDKAVRPTSVMGASKRVAEMIVRANGALIHHSTSTRFAVVRFGNVLDSSGSVVPKFREQIARGGPVTVTHRDIVRYFMTISEASQLVIQAGAMTKTGDLFHLDMGKPVRIYDLALRMIRLSGLVARDEQHSDGDVTVEFTGLRSGEKLYEELLVEGSVQPTAHPSIWRAGEKLPVSVSVTELYEKFVKAFDAGDTETVIELFTTAIPDYSPSKVPFEQMTYENR